MVFNIDTIKKWIRLHKILNPLCSLKQTYQLKCQQIKILAHLSKLEKKGRKKCSKKCVWKKQLKSDKHSKSATFGHHQRHSIPSFAKFLLLHLVLISLTHPFKDHVCKGKFWQSSSAHWGQNSLWGLISNLLLLWFHKYFEIIPIFNYC